MIKDIDERIQAIKAEMHRLAELVGSSSDNLPPVSTSALDNTATIVCEHDCIKYIHSERGSEILYLKTTSIKELMVRIRYKIISPVLGDRYKITNEEGMREKYKKHRELYQQLGPEFVEAHDKQVEKVLKTLQQEDNDLK